VSNAADLDTTKRDGGAVTQTGGRAEIGIDDGPVWATQLHQGGSQDEDCRDDDQT
jgi:hypothetical protein